jgi:serine/threonine protein kinase
MNDEHFGLPGPGQTIDDFDLLELLGTGSFARVFLARQRSLGRLVALKVSRNRGQEARTLANLEHDHIVRVFSEVVDREHDLRLLCMQYVPGTTLEKVITRLRELPPDQRNGRAILDFVDSQSTGTTALDLGALRDREALGKMDLIEAGCWMGARLAEALAHAHDQGVLHRDIKPANVLINRYGRPLLVDFNVATGKPDAQATDDGETLFGGTLAYMAPEHIDAFNSEDYTPIEAVNAQSDIYSLGLVVYELFSCQMAFPVADMHGRKISEVLWEMAGQRRAGAPSLPVDLGALPALKRVLARCLAPRPEDRYQSAAELAVELDSCREHRRVQRDLPPGRWLTQRLVQHPFLVGVLLMLLPQVLGTMVNIIYNSLRIVSELTPRQQEAFVYIIVLYNAVCWPVCLGIVIRLALPVWRAWKLLSQAGSGSSLTQASSATIDDARRRALHLPDLCVALASLGWLTGGVVFPLALHWWVGPLAPIYFGRFLFSFTLSGLIAVTYSVLGLEYVIYRVLYPSMWLDARQMRQTARSELDPEEGRLAVLQFLAVLIPLAGAALMIGVGEDISQQSTRTFRGLVTALLGLGMLGLGLALWTARQLRETMRAIIGS